MFRSYSAIACRQLDEVVVFVTSEKCLNTDAVLHSVASPLNSNAAFYVVDPVTTSNTPVKSSVDNNLDICIVSLYDG